MPQGRGDSSKTLQILDFDVGHDMHDVLPSDSLVVKTITKAPSWVPRDGIFGRNVITRLPYSTTTRKISENYSGLMIDEDMIVGLKVRALPIFFSHVYSITSFAGTWLLR